MGVNIYWDGCVQCLLLALHYPGYNDSVVFFVPVTPEPLVVEVLRRSGVATARTVLLPVTLMEIMMMIQYWYK